MSYKPDEQALTRFVVGECTDEEREEINHWMSLNPEHRRRVERLINIWNVTGPVQSEWDTAAAWKRVQQRIRPDVRLARADRPPRPARDYRIRRHTPIVFRTLAILALVGIVTVLMIGLPEKTDVAVTAPPVKVFETGKGQRATITLADGTEIRLNVMSRLVVPESFREDARQVTLEGEAHFDVASDPDRPFRVTMRDAVVEVLGTAFTVRSYEDEEDVQVVVSEGRVLLQAAAEPSSSATLAPNDLGVVRKGELRPVRHNVNLDLYMAWLEGRLVFVDAPFDYVADQLERWYDLDVEVQVPTEEIKLLNVRFTTESVREILNVIAATLDLKYEGDERRVVFYR